MTLRAKGEEQISEPPTRIVSSSNASKLLTLLKRIYLIQISNVFIIQLFDERRKLPESLDPHRNVSLW
jgi:hypothetical protein